ncbi:ferredoxin--nitrite reductase [Candidatus Nitronereus thalassa]|uniref:Ferredoxin--nitrite reductase n=1 Tax=Candidatus Nitronereus thalassa TaxID=3020898 RepID=A0ABU3K9S8_9BACT|nr:ferredoxin--nitrite reductase [Candidatus Nitronereus thalassa]MDT7043166.1 ferredoxin--nitrite reductase [Candidatus Nitronereus thalassa]
MNKFEVLKHERDGLDIMEDLPMLAKTGWESISDDDIQRLKWYGLFLRNPTPGYFMIRVRIPGGRATSAQLRTLAEIALTFGNGQLDFTTRQQIQLRHLRIEHVPEAFARMDEVGLTSLQTGLDNVRNIMTCPVAGLSPTECLDATSVVHALNEEIVGNREYTNLPRKFNVVITGCPDNCLHAETQDLALVPATKDIDGETKVGFNVLVGGKLGSGGFRIATPLDVFVLPEDAVQVSCAVIKAFRDYGFRDSRTTARLAFLLEEWGEVRFRVEVERQLGHHLLTAGKDARKNSENLHGGVFRQPQMGLNYAGLHIPVGRIEGKGLLKLCELAERFGTSALRLGANQTLVIPNIHDKALGEFLEEPVLQKFGYNPSPIRKGLVSCVGSDYCNLAVIETKSQAMKTAAALEAKVVSEIKPITMHWSGCPAGCGNHLVADIGLLGKKIKRRGQIVEAVDVYVGGRSGPDAKLATKLLEDVPCEELAEVLAGVVPYHAREKMHREKKRMRPKSASVRTSTAVVSPSSLVKESVAGRL